MKLSNGNTLMAAETFTATLKGIRGRYDSYQSAAEFAVFHLCEHGDKTKLERLFKAFVGARGKLVGDGVALAKYVNAYTYGFTIQPDASVKIDVKKNKKPKPRGFKGRNDSGDLSWKVGGHNLGFVDSMKAWEKAEAAKAEERKAEAEAKAEAAEELKQKAEAAEAEAKAANAEEGAEEGAEDHAPDFKRASDLAEALRTMAEAFKAGNSLDVEALAEAKAEADKLAEAIADRMAEAKAAEASAEAPEAEESAEADTAAEA